MRNSYRVASLGFIPGLDSESMKTLILLSVLLTTFSAQANITCKGALQYAMEDVTALNGALATGISFEDAKAALNLEIGRHRDVILACTQRGQNVYEYCQTVPRALRVRIDIIADEYAGTKKERRLLIHYNERNREFSRILCP